MHAPLLLVPVKISIVEDRRGDLLSGGGVGNGERWISGADLDGGSQIGDIGDRRIISLFLSLLT